MKTLLSLASALLALSASAADFQLYFGDQPVEAGKTYETGYTIDQDASIPGVFTSYVQSANVFIRGEKGETLTIEVSGDNTVSVCSFGDCTIISPANPTMSKTGTLGAENPSAPAGSIVMEDTDIHQITELAEGEDPKTALNDITVDISVYRPGNPFGAKTVKVKMRAVPQSEIGGVGNVASDTYYVKAAANAISYNVNALTSVAIFDASGAQVKGAIVNGEGTLSLADLAKGVYVYTAGEYSGKILIK